MDRKMGREMQRRREEGRGEWRRVRERERERGTGWARGVDKVDGVGCWLDSGTDTSSKKDNITIIMVFI